MRNLRFVAVSAVVMFVIVAGNAQAQTCTLSSIVSGKISSGARIANMSCRDGDAIYLPFTLYFEYTGYSRTADHVESTLVVKQQTRNGQLRIKGIYALPSGSSLQPGTNVVVTRVSISGGGINVQLKVNGGINPHSFDDISKIVQFNYAGNRLP